MRDRYLEADTMLHVLHENRKVRPNYDNMKFADSQLVDLDSLPQMQRVTMFSDQVRRFRDDYTLLVFFAAHVCGVPTSEFTPLHLAAYFEKQRATSAPSPPSPAPPAP